MVNALWCYAQLANCDGVCVHGEKAARLYKPAHFTACCYLHQVSNGALDANPWPGASFITNANEIWDRNVQIWFYKWSYWSSRGDKFCVLTNGSSASSKKKVLKERPFFPKFHSAYWKRGSTRSCWHMSGHDSFSLIINPLFLKVRFNLEWNVESKKKEINLHKSPAVPLAFKRKGEKKGY